MVKLQYLSTLNRKLLKGKMVQMKRSVHQILAPDINFIGNIACHHPKND